MFSESPSCWVRIGVPVTLKRLCFCVFSLEVRQLLQTNATLQKELEGVREGEEERRGREEALR